MNDQNTQTENIPPLPPADYPVLGLPEDPKGACIPKTPDGIRPDCEGQMYQPQAIETSPVPAPAPEVKRIMIAIPLLAVTYEFFESFLKFWTSLMAQRDPKVEVGYHFAYRKPVHMAEESLVDIARYNRCTHILFMDDDIYDVTREDLYKLLDADKDVIGGVMHASKFPHATCVFRRYNLNRKVIDMPSDNSIYRLYEVPCVCSKCNAPQSHWDGKHCPMCGEPQNNLIQEADLIPFPFTLMKLSIFDQLKKPWFHCTNKYPTDSWFADRIIEAGLKIHAHMGVRLNHAGITDQTKPFYVQMGMAKAQQQKAVVTLTPEQMDTHQRMLINKMKETEEKN